MTITEFLKQTIDGKLSLDQQKEYLLNKPFGTPEEIAETVNYLYEQMPTTPNLPGAIDICGTGGSGLSRVNTSTISAFVVAGAGVKVAKHGNNTASGKFGSFDLLSALEVPINLSNQELQLRFHEYNLAFLYAKSFHPIMRFFGPVRTSLKQPTFFNILGPLLSPVKANRQLIGTPKVEYARLIAEVAKVLGKERVIVVTGSDGLDEVTLTGPTHVVELSNGNITEYDVTPEDFGAKPVENFAEIASESSEENVRLAQAILSGNDQSPRTDLVLVNSAMALFLAGAADELKTCYELARKSLESGKAAKALEDYCKPSVLIKIINRNSSRNFGIDSDLKNSGQKYRGGIIAEIKRHSPSEGSINQRIDIVAQAKIYEAAEASAISILTEPEDFGGSFDDLKKIRQATDLPLLCKDFIVSKEHIDKAKSCGADIILLIAAVLDEKKLKELYQHASEQGLQVLLEVHTRSELEKALKIQPEIIGVNSRNLHDFSLQPELFNELADQIPKGIIKVAESGIANYKDKPKNYDGILVGTILMKHPFPALKIKELSGKPLLKLCGIRNLEAALLCESLGVDMIGINFVPRSNRRVDLETAKKIAGACSNTIPVGIFENQDADEVNKIAKETGVKAVQLSGHEQDLDEYELPIIKTVRLGEDKPLDAFMYIIDSRQSGSGEKIDYNQLENFEPSLIAGGVDMAAAERILEEKKPLGVDTASGIETDGKIDNDKIKELYKLVASITY